MSFFTRKPVPEALPLHPYYPTTLSIPYVPNTWTVPSLLSVFFSACALLLTTTYLISTRLNPRLPLAKHLTIQWFALSAAIHLLFESHYVLNFRSLSSSNHLIAQMWKEYAFADSRYLSQNSIVLAMEASTVVFWGPGCVVVAACIVAGKKWDGLRFPLQAIVSLGQMYGDALYYVTSGLDWYLHGTEYSRPEPFYFWFYFVTMNAFWIVIPGYLVYQSVVETMKAFQLAAQVKEQKKAS